MGHRLLLRPLAFLVLLAAAWGCQGDEGKPKNLATAWGKITFDGSPVEEGFIEFQHVPGKWIQGSSPISEGDYRAELPPGSYLVRIHASRLAKPGEPGHGPGGYLMYIPSHYNAKSTLKIDLPAEGGEFSFELTSKEPKKK
jgi:hypothetical protein